MMFMLDLALELPRALLMALALMIMSFSLCMAVATLYRWLRRVALWAWEALH